MDNKKQKRGLATTLRLRRRAVGATPPSVNPLPQPVNQLPPPINPLPNPPQQPAWTSAQKVVPQQPKDMLGGAQVVRAAKANFERGLKEDMPTIHKSKQFALTVDGERIAQKKKSDEARKTAADSNLPDPGEAPIVGELTVLSNALQVKVKTLETHTSTVRTAAGNKDFITADTEFTEALKIANEILGEDAKFQKMLEEADEAPVTELAGSGPPPKPVVSQEGLDFRRRWDDSRDGLEDLLEIKSNNEAVKRNLTDLRFTYQDLVKADKEEKFDVAEGLLDTAIEEGGVLKMLHKAALQFEEAVANFAPDLMMVRKFPMESATPTDVANRNGAVDAHKLALEKANDGQFVAANTELEKARDFASKLIPEGSGELRAYEYNWKQLEPKLLQSLSVKSDSNYVKSLQVAIAEEKKGIEDDAADQKYEAANMAMENAELLTRALDYAARDWEIYVSTKERSSNIYSAATDANPANNEQTALQDQCVAKLKSAGEAMDLGKLSKALGDLESARTFALEFVELFQGKDASEYFRQAAAEEGRYAAAEKIVPRGALITEAKKAFVEARKMVAESVSGGNFDTALGDLDLCNTRCYMLEFLNKQMDSIENLKKTYKKNLDGAPTAKDTIGGVPALKITFAAAMQQFTNLLDTNLDQALPKLKEVITVANKINGLVEGSAKQADRKKELDETIGQAGKTYMPKGFTENLKQGTNPGEDTLWDHFLFVSQLTEDDRDDANLTNLGLAAQTWLTEFEKRDKDLPDDPTLLKRKTACETALKQSRHLKLANRYETLGDLPWDQATEDKAADLKMQVLFETGERPMENAGGGGVNGAKWIMSTDFEKDKGSKDFVFKKAKGGPPIAGFENDAEAIREVLGDALGKQLKAATGLEFNVPETRVVTIDSKKIDPSKESKDVVGSAQAGAATVGGVIDLIQNDPEALKKIKPQAMQKAAIFDALALNLDRHSGNFLVTPPDEDGGNEVVPIDNGLAFPSREGLKVRGGRAAATSAFTDVPASFEKFDPDMLAAIEMINEDELVAGLKSRATSLSAQQPTLNVATAVPDETINLVKRNTQFLKAAAPRVSPGILMDLIMENDAAIFDTPETEKAAAFEEVIKKGEKRDKEIGPYANMGPQEKLDLYSQLWHLGWNNAYGDANDRWEGNRAMTLFRAWVLRNPKVALKLASSKKVNSSLEAETRKIVSEIKALDPQSKVDEELAGLSVGAAHWDAKKLLKDAKTKGQASALEQQFRAEFPDDPAPNKKVLECYQQYVRYNGKDIATVGKTKLAKLSFVDRWNLISPMMTKAGETEVLDILLDELDMKQQFKRFGMNLVEASKNEARIQAVNDWKEVKKLGGLEAFSKLGGDLQSYTRPSEVLDLFAASKSTDGVDVDA